MAERRPALRSGLAGTPHDSREVQLRAFPLLYGRLVEVDTTGGAVASVYVRHGLGRRFVGAIMCGQTGGGGLAVTAHPEAVISAGYDPAEYCGVLFSAATAALVRLWVF